MNNDFPPSRADDSFDNALRAGPPPVKLPTGFHQRTENAWRLAAATREAPSEPLAGIESLVRDLFGPALACLAIALVVLAVQFAPRAGSPSPRIPPELAASAPATPLPSLPQVVVEPKTVVAALGESVEQPFADEADRMLQDARRALRFAADQLLPAEMARYAEARGFDGGLGG